MQEAVPRSEAAPQASGPAVSAQQGTGSAGTSGEVLVAEHRFDGSVPGAGPSASSSMTLRWFSMNFVCTPGRLSCRT